MISRWIRTWNGRYLAPLVDYLARAGVHPDTLTLTGLGAEVVAGLLLAINQPGWALAWLLLGQVLDSLDGELARRRGTAGPLGGFVDSICDHYGDLAVYLGLLWHSLQAPAGTDIILIAVALFGSVFGSHVRSRAGMAGIDTGRVGIFTRFERTVVLAAGISLGRVSIALWVLAVLNNFSALQRIVYAVRAAHGRSEAVRG
jgi:archaetidylinositol phosphate synthase